MKSAGKTNGFALTFGLVLAIALVAPGCSPRSGDAVVARVGSHNITLAEYEQMFEKSSGTKEAASAASLEEKEKFLGLLTNFRLKLADAYQNRLDRREDVLAEIDQYKGSLAASFLTERDVTRPGIQHLYQRRSEEIRARHILLNLPAGPDADTASVYARAQELIARLKAGEDFATLAREYSNDPSVQQNGGDLYFFSGGQMVPPFEDAAYAMKVGEISSHPIRTQFGLHILKIVDRRPAPGEVLCSHIMIRFEKPDPTPEDTASAFARIQAILDSIKAGEDFAELAKRNSEDPGSAPRGGDLGWFTRRRWIQSFDEVALGMQPGQISPIVRTIYGYHIIKCYDRRPPKSFEEARSDLQQLYQQTRFQDDYKRYIEKAKQETRFSYNWEALAQFLTSFDSSKTMRDTAWAESIHPHLSGMALMRIAGSEISVDSTVAILKGRQDLVNTPLRAASIMAALDKLAEQLVFAEKADALMKTSPAFAAIMKEYTEGILLYQIEQDRVWNRVTVTDSALHAYFEANRERFAYPDRVDFTSIRIANDSLAQLLYARIKAGKTLEAVAAEDSVRMKEPTSFQAIFQSGSATLSAQAKRMLGTVAAELKRDPNTRVHLTSHADTLRNKTQNLRLATRRIDAIKSYFTTTHKISEGRIGVVPAVPTKADQVMTSEERAKRNAMIDVMIVGRRPVVIGGIESKIQPTDADTRAEMAAGLAEGEVSAPFSYMNMPCIVRLNKREPARLKTFDEAGTELSSAFQEYESKRLEQEWLDSLRKQHPVVEYKEELAKAFGTTR